MILHGDVSSLPVHTLTSLLLWRGRQIDGNGVMLNGYNRNASIVGNEFAWVGATCVASWGYSSTCFNKNCSLKLPWREGPDARGGEQPRGTRVLNNLFR